MGEAGEVEGGGEAGVEVSEEAEGEVEEGASRHEVWTGYKGLMLFVTNDTTCSEL